jgi:hypothetical protein
MQCSQRSDQDTRKWKPHPTLASRIYHEHRKNFSYAAQISDRGGVRCVKISNRMDWGWRCLEGGNGETLPRPWKMGWGRWSAGVWGCHRHAVEAVDGAEASLPRVSACIDFAACSPPAAAAHRTRRHCSPRPPLLTVKFRQPSHEFTFGIGMTFVSYPLVLTPVV